MEAVVAVAGTTIMSTVKAVAAMAGITTTMMRDAVVVIMITNTQKAAPVVGNIISIIMKTGSAAVDTTIMKMGVSAAANIITIMRMDAVVAIMTMMRNITIILINVITITKKRIKLNNNRDQGVKSKLLALFCYEY